MYCYSCLKPKIGTHLYCAKCKKSIFNGIDINPLTFDKKEFYQARRRMGDRMSISGVQDKISLKFSDELNLVPTEKEGKYILKPVPQSEELENIEELPANEHISMQISEQVFKINTASSALIPFSNGELAYVTKRFDYAINGTKLDQEDFASVLNTTSENGGDNYKYDSSYELCAEAIKKFVPSYILEIEELYKRVLLNFLIGNGDAHLKNFSLLIPFDSSEYKLSPNYDILYTKYHANEKFGQMGLELFETTSTKSYDAFGSYSLEDFETFGLMVGIPKRRLQKLFTQVINSTEEVKSLVDRCFLSDVAKGAYLNNYTHKLKSCMLYTIDTKGYEFDSCLKRIADAKLHEIDRK